MSNQNENNQIQKSGGKANDNLIKFASLSYNPAGFLPSEVRYHVMLSDLKVGVMEHVKSFLSDITNITFEINYKNGDIATFVWLPNDSRHIRDTSAMSDKSAVRLPITRFSVDLKEFMDKFCANEHKRLVGEDSGMRLVGIRIDLGRILKILFDDSGIKFSKDYGTRKVNTSIKVIPTFAKGDDNHTFGKFRFLEVVKYTKTGFEEKSPKPRRSFNAVKR